MGQSLCSASLPVLSGKHGGPAPPPVDPARALLFLVLPHLCSTSLCLEISSVCTVNKHCVLSDRSPSFCVVHAPYAHSGGSAYIFHTYWLRDGIPCQARTGNMHERGDQATLWPHVSRVSECEQWTGKGERLLSVTQPNQCLCPPSR